MRHRMVLYVVLVGVAVLLLLPLSSYSPSEKSSVTIKVEASLAEGSYDPAYSISFDEGSSSYLDHVGVWWGGVFNPVSNPSKGLEIYPLVTVRIEPNWGASPVTGMYQYQFGDSWHCTYKIPDVPDNGQIEVTVVLYWDAERTDGGLVRTYVA